MLRGFHERKYRERESYNTAGGYSSAEKKCSESSYRYRQRGCSTISLGRDDIEIVVSKNSNKQLTGLTLEQQDGKCLVVRQIMEGSLFANTKLSVNMEIRVINGVDCTQLDGTFDAYTILNEPERTMTIVARQKVKRDEPILLRLQEHPKRSAGAAHMWLDMVDVSYHKSIDAPRLSSPPKEESQDECIEAPSAPNVRKACPPQHKNVPLEEVDKKEMESSSHSAMSEITLNQSQHPVLKKPADIVISRPMSPKSNKVLFGSIKSVLESMYPDYDDEGVVQKSPRGKQQKSHSNVINIDDDKVSIVYSSTHDVSLAPTSLKREESPATTSSSDGSSIPMPLLEDSEEFVGSFRADPIASNSLCAPSIPRVSAKIWPAPSVPCGGR